MQYLYIATIFAGALVCLLASLLLFARRKAGERSRMILSIIVFFSVYNYITRFISLCTGNVPEFVVSGKLLLQANFMILAYTMYPIEVIAPGWLNVKRLLKLSSLWLSLVVVYLISLWVGVEYTPYDSLVEMVTHADGFDVWFRLLLALLIFSPIVFVGVIHRTSLYKNADHIWIKKYVITIFINTLAYVLVLMFNHELIHTVYYYISVGCSLYIVYMELFDRLIGKTVVKEPMEEHHIQSTILSSDELVNEGKGSIEQKNAALIQRLNDYMITNSAWRNPDLSLNHLASELFTNRTTLAQAVREHGYENYTYYINKLRVDDFVQQITSGQFENFQEAFFFVGFRSRNTALRNFRQFTGMIPSEYFQKKEVEPG
ncbi:MAG: helix-turn-helix transcriptional regulator [Prevotellaceae bacterium]|nr:helix-turn-helix transcriptional regulator [Prevotellaceae bacterium]